MFNIKGVLKVIGTEQQVSEKFRKRDFVLTDNSTQYPQHISFQLTQDKCSLLDGLNIGDEVTAYFNLRGREWTDKQGITKYFNTVDVWKIERPAAINNNEQWAGTGPGTGSNASTVNNAPQEDDLPF